MRIGIKSENNNLPIIKYVLSNIKQKKEFEQVFNKRLGKIVGKIIIFLLFAFFLFKFFYLLEENFSFLKQTLYTEATTLVYLICVLPVVNAMVYKGLKSFGRTTGGDSGNKWGKYGV